MPANILRCLKSSLVFLPPSAGVYRDYCMLETWLSHLKPPNFCKQFLRKIYASSKTDQLWLTTPLGFNGFTCYLEGRFRPPDLYCPTITVLLPPSVFHQYQYSHYALNCLLFVIVTRRSTDLQVIPNFPHAKPKLLLVF